MNENPLPRLECKHGELCGGFHSALSACLIPYIGHYEAQREVDWKWHLKTVKPLVEAAERAQSHIAELRDAWERGALSEHDGLGGTRSNRNVDVGSLLRAALAAWRKEP